MPRGFSLYSERRPTTRRGSGAAAQARKGACRPTPIRIANALVTRMESSSLVCSPPPRPVRPPLGRTLFRFELLLRHLKGQEGRLGRHCLLGPQGLEPRERFPLLGRVAQ